MRLTFRPLPDWPHPVTTNRSSGRFKATYSKTLMLLEHELVNLHAHGVVVGAGFRESDLRLDGTPRADRRQAPYIHPGVELSFDSKHGHLTYATDEFHDWQDNLRAIALSLEALRAVDRYGVSKRGQQYAGWAQLAAGGPDAERGRVLVERAGGMIEAMKRYHPDLGGTDRDMVDVLAFRDLQPAGAR